MRKKRYKSITRVCVMVGALVSAVLSFSACLGTCVGERATYEEVFRNNWGINLPVNMDKEFSKSEDSFHGDGIRFAVFRLEEATDFFEDFLKDESEEIISNVNKLLVDVNFDIPGKYLPDWENEFYWKHLEQEFSEEFPDCDCYIVYFPDSFRLMICQSFY